jgi:hypothetical protein
MVSTVTANLEAFNARQKKVMDEVIITITPPLAAKRYTFLYLVFLQY